MAGLVEWPVLLAVGGGALLLHRMHRKPETPPKANLTTVPRESSPKKAVPQSAAKPAAKKTAGRRAGASELRSTN